MRGDRLVLIGLKLCLISIELSQRVYEISYGIVLLIVLDLCSYMHLLFVMVVNSRS